MESYARKLAAQQDLGAQQDQNLQDADGGSLPAGVPRFLEQAANLVAQISLLDDPMQAQAILAPLGEDKMFGVGY